MKFQKKVKQLFVLVNKKQNFQLNRKEVITMNRVIVVLSFIAWMFMLMSSHPGTVNARQIEDTLVWEGPKEDMHVWRAQVIIKVANVDGAETADDVYLELNDKNFTGLEKPGDNFNTRGKVYVYDLMLSGVWQLKDIEHMKIGTTGTDKLYIEWLALIINTRTIYTHYIGNTFYVDKTRSLIAKWSMRSNWFWKNYTVPPRPTTISVREIMSRIQSVVGTKRTHNSRYYWNGQVKIFPSGNNELYVYLYPKIDSYGRVGVPNAAMWFKLKFSCDRKYSGVGILNVDVQNLSARGWWDSETDAIGEEIQNALSAIMGFSVPWKSLYYVPYWYEVPFSCGSIKLDPGTGDLSIIYDRRYLIGGF